MINARRKVDLLIWLLTIISSGYCGWIACVGAARVVHRDAAHIRLHEFGLGFVADGTECVFALGPEGSVIAGLLLGTVLAVFVPLRKSRDGLSR